MHTRVTAAACIVLAILAGANFEKALSFGHQFTSWINKEVCPSFQQNPILYLILPILIFTFSALIGTSPSWNRPRAKTRHRIT